MENEIKITHVVNPHLFFFRWVRDEGFNEELQVLESKIENIAKKGATDSKSDDSTVSDVKIGSVAGVFVSDWNKWIRATIKKKDGEGSNVRFCVWAIDYGYPLVVRAAHVIKLPLSFQGRTLKKRILTGGVENILPADTHYDIALATNVKERLENWSPKSIQLIQDVLRHSIKLEFVNVHEYKHNKSHFFGRLMVQRPDGQMMNIVSCLMSMHMASLTDDFIEEFKNCKTIQQPYWLSVDGEMLHSNFVVAPVVITKEGTGYTDKDLYDNEFIGDAEEIELDPDDEHFFDESVSVLHSTSRNGQAAALPKSSTQPKDSSNENGQSVDEQRKSRNRKYNRNKKVDGRDQNRSDDKNQKRSDNQNNQRPQQFPTQRGAVPKPQNTHPNNQNQFSQPPPNSFNSSQSHVNQRLYVNHPPGPFNQYQNRRCVGGYVPPNSHQSPQNRRNRNNPPRNVVGDPEFEASFHHPPLQMITENVPMSNALPYQSAMHPYPRPSQGHGNAYGRPYNQRNQPNDRQNNWQNARNAPQNRNHFKKPTENADVKSDTQSTSTEKTDTTEIESKIKSMNIKTEAAEDETNSNGAAKSATSQENVVVKDEPKQDNQDE